MTAKGENRRPTRRRYWQRLSRRSVEISPDAESARGSVRAVVATRPLRLPRPGLQHRAPHQPGRGRGDDREGDERVSRHAQAYPSARPTVTTSQAAPYASASM